MKRDQNVEIISNGWFNVVVCGDRASGIAQVGGG
jgi:hypothetical protein